MTQPGFDRVQLFTRMVAHSVNLMDGAELVHLDILGEPASEYLRGQVELICDAVGMDEGLRTPIAEVICHLAGVRLAPQAPRTRDDL